ncbi:MAG TPA: methyltransferase domain-containing protein, partial [Bryobacteraceae bacterium]
IDARLLDILRTRKDAPGNLTTVLASPDDPKLAPASVDIVFFLHHIEGRAAYLAKLKRALKPDGGELHLHRWTHWEYFLVFE